MPVSITLTVDSNARTVRAEPFPLPEFHLEDTVNWAIKDADAGQIQLRFFHIDGPFSESVDPGSNSILSTVGREVIFKCTVLDGQGELFWPDRLNGANVRVSSGPP